MLTKAVAAQSKADVKHGTTTRGKGEQEANVNQRLAVRFLFVVGALSQCN
jgi:hypothetical protein